MTRDMEFTAETIHDIEMFIDEETAGWIAV